MQNPQSIPNNTDRGLKLFRYRHNPDTGSANAVISGLIKNFIGIMMFSYLSPIKRFNVSSSATVYDFVRSSFEIFPAFALIITCRISSTPSFA